jgi:hypothetical protein
LNCGFPQRDCNTSPILYGCCELFFFRYQRINSLKQVNPNLKTLLAVGGASVGTKGMSAMLSAAANRQQFINSSINFLRANNLDGLDLDFEFPGSADKPLLSLLIQVVLTTSTFNIVTSAHRFSLVRNDVGSWSISYQTNCGNPLYVYRRKKSPRMTHFANATWRLLLLRFKNLRFQLTRMQTVCACLVQLSRFRAGRHSRLLCSLMGPNYNLNPVFLAGNLLAGFDITRDAAIWAISLSFAVWMQKVTCRTLHVEFYSPKSLATIVD